MGPRVGRRGCFLAKFGAARWGGGDRRDASCTWVLWIVIGVLTHTVPTSTLDPDPDLDVEAAQSYRAAQKERYYVGAAPHAGTQAQGGPPHATPSGFADLCEKAFSDSPLECALTPTWPRSRCSSWRSGAGGRRRARACGCSGRSRPPGSRTRRRSPRASCPSRS